MDKGGIPGRMSKMIIKEFEIVHVEIGKGQMTGCLAGPSHIDLHRFINMPVGGAGQGIGGRQKDVRAERRYVSAKTKLDVSTSVPKWTMPLNIPVTMGIWGFSMQATICQAIAPASEMMMLGANPVHHETATGIKYKMPRERYGPVARSKKAMTKTSKSPAATIRLPPRPVMKTSRSSPSRSVCGGRVRPLACFGIKRGAALIVLFSK